MHRHYWGLLSVHSHYGLHTRAVTTFCDSLSEGFSHFVTSMTAPLASGWSISPGGILTHWKAPPCHGAHPLPTSAPKRSGHRTCSYGAGGDRVRLALTSISPAGGYVEGSMQQLVDIGMGPAGDVWVT